MVKVGAKRGGDALVMVRDGTLAVRIGGLPPGGEEEEEYTDDAMVRLDELRGQGIVGGGNFVLNLSGSNCAALVRELHLEYNVVVLVVHLQAMYNMSREVVKSIVELVELAAPTLLHLRVMCDVRPTSQYVETMWEELREQEGVCVESFHERAAKMNAEMAELKVGAW
jgi:hypothetical protein